MDLELGVAGVEGEGERVRFAGFDGAGEEVEGEELHCGGGYKAVFEGWVNGCRSGVVVWWRCLGELREQNLGAAVKGLGWGETLG